MMLDRDDRAPVVILDDVLAAKLWPGQSALGKHIRMSPMISQGDHWLEVIGVVREIKHLGPERPVKWAQVYVPQYQDPSPALAFVVNANIPIDAVKNAAEKALHDLDKELPVENFERLDAYLDNNFLAARRASLLLLSAFASIGILLGAVGVYAIAANSVTRRQREIAIRMALGATPQRTVVLITRLGVFATAGGVLIGSAIVLALTRLLASMLYGVSALDPLIYGISAALLLFLAFMASLVSTARLLRLNIQEILRQ